jgi:hypothetical protein
MRAMAKNRLLILIVPTAAVALALAACGSDDSTASTEEREAEAREAALEFAQCMRENGVDMPDPEVGEGGRLTFRSQAPGMDSGAAFERAQEACQKHLQSIRPEEPSAEEQSEFRERALNHARCMREHGIDVPDPTFRDGGGVLMQMPEGIDPNDPAFQEAEEACARFGPEIEEGS